MREKIADIFESVIEEGGILAHGVNCMGVMGGGIALEIANRWPIVKEKYCKRVASSLDEAPGYLLNLVQIVAIPDTKIAVANCFTQIGYGRERRHLSYDALDVTMRNLAEIDKAIHVPMIGAGLAGGEASICREIILSAFRGRNDCILYILPI